MLCTGLRWDHASPAVWFLDGGRPLRVPVAAGRTMGWRIDPPRWCIGRYEHGRRRPCAFAEAPRPPVSQCPACSDADPGRRVVRERGSPAGVFCAYLALFDAETIKVGLTAASRGPDRLLEQGAAAHAWLCEGSYPAVRRVENLLTIRMGVVQQLSWRQKRSYWRRLGDTGERLRTLAEAAERARALLDGSLRLLTGPPVDDLPCYRLAGEILDTLQVVEVVQPGDVLAGRVAGVIGRMLVMAAGLVIDTQRLEGWHLLPLPPGASARFASPPQIESCPTGQPALFG